MIAVIAGLGALLLPSLREAHQNVKRVVCGSNMRQVHIAMGVYAADNDFHFPTRWDQRDYADSNIRNQSYEMLSLYRWSATT